jgi:hypothetical protein
VPFDDRVNLRVQPAWISELDGRRPSKVDQQQLEQLRAPLLGRRELEQDRSRAIAQGLHSGAEVAGDDVLGKPLRRVGESALGLEAELEAGRRVADPFRQGGLPG